VLSPALQAGHVSWLIKMRPNPPLALLNHETPTSAALHRQVDRLSLDRGQPSSERLPVGRNDTAASTHAGRGVHHVERDLLSMQIQPTYDRHSGLLERPGDHGSGPL
jgi:hypothetical protein